MSTSDSDPFGDAAQAADSAETPTLDVGRGASLTLATDSLIILDEDFTRRESGGCCGMLHSSPKTTQLIPYFNILWAELNDYEVVIQYAKPAARNHVRVSTVQYIVEKPQKGRAMSWLAILLDRAYGGSQPRKRIKVLINPFGGKGSAQKWWLRDIEPIFQAARCKVDVEKTLHQGHAVAIAESLDIDAYDVVASCSGDGLPHEVFNGLAKKDNAAVALSKIAVVQLPCGTGNAMSLNLNGTDSTSIAALCIVKGIRIPLDLVSITQGQNRTLSFLSQSVGIVADVDLGTENLRWMGSLRFSYGFLIRLLRKTVYPCDLAVKVEIPTKPQIRDHYRKKLQEASQHTPTKSAHVRTETGLPELKQGTVKSVLPSTFTSIPAKNIGNFYAGNMALMAPGTNVFPATLPSDGFLDLVTIDGNIGRIAAIKSFLAVENGNFFDMPHVGYRKVSGYRITPLGQHGGYISIDGERVPFEPFQAELHPGLGCTLSKSGPVYEAEGVISRNAAIG